VTPPPAVSPITIDDPRVQVQHLDAGEPSPAAGVWMNQWTFERLIEVTKPPDSEQTSR
jgi:hypothetical protein